MRRKNDLPKPDPKRKSSVGAKERSKPECQRLKLHAPSRLCRSSRESCFGMGSFFGSEDTERALLLLYWRVLETWGVASQSVVWI